MSDADDLLGDDPEEARQLLEDFEARRQALFERMWDFMDEEGIDEAYMSDLLFDAAINMRMTAYGWGVENPSVGGLKLDLDRVTREVADMLREAKKRAEDFIIEVKDKRAQAEAEAGEQEKAEPEAEEPA
jgi:hypothetical protein